MNPDILPPIVWVRTYLDALFEYASGRKSQEEIQALCKEVADKEREFIRSVTGVNASMWS